MPKKHEVFTIYAGDQVDEQDVLELVQSISAAYESIGGSPLTVRKTTVPLDEARRAMQAATRPEGEGEAR